MHQFPMLSLIIFWPILGSFAVLAAHRHPRLVRWLSLGVTLVELGLVASLLFTGSDTSLRSRGVLAAGGGLSLDPLAGGPLPPGIGRHQPHPGYAHRLHQHLLYPHLLGGHPGKSGVFLFLHPILGRDSGRTLFGQRSAALLSLLGDPDHPHVLPGRHLGPPEPVARLHQVPPLYPG